VFGSYHKLISQLIEKEYFFHQIFMIQNQDEKGKQSNTISIESTIKFGGIFGLQLIQTKPPLVGHFKKG